MLFHQYPDVPNIERSSFEIIRVPLLSERTKGSPEIHTIKASQEYIILSFSFALKGKKIVIKDESGNKLEYTLFTRFGNDIGVIVPIHKFYGLVNIELMNPDNTTIQTYEKVFKVEQN